MSEQDIKQLTAHLFRENSGKIVAVLAKFYGLGQLDAISDIVQDTFEAALKKWKYGNIPDNPSAWLMKVAKNKAINYFKRNSRYERFSVQQNQLDNNELDRFFLPDEISDSQLRLLLTCCNPSFSEKSQILLTLSVLSGFGRKELANALLMGEEAVKKTVTRAKKTLRDQEGSLTVVPLNSTDRIHVVHKILYLMFNEGHKSTRSEQLINHDLCYEAIRLSKLLLHEKVVLKKETNALLALMFFALARFPARLTPEGEIVTLKHQDRSKWDHTFIDEGYYYLNQAMGGDSVNTYYLEALISSVHCTSETFETTDWQKVVFLYEQLEALEPSPIVSLNRIVATSYAQGPQIALQQLHNLLQKEQLSKYHLFHAVEGDLFERLGKKNLAIRAYKRSIDLSSNEAEKKFLKRRIEELARS